MAEAINLNIEERTEGQNPRQMRSEGFLPATIYGKGQESLSVKVETRTFVNTYKNNKEAVYSLTLGDKKFETVVACVQKNYATDAPLNVEFKLV